MSEIFAVVTLVVFGLAVLLPFILDQLGVIDLTDGGWFDR